MSKIEHQFAKTRQNILYMTISLSRRSRKIEDTKVGNQKPKVEDGQTIQWPKKGQKDKQRSTKHYTEH